MNGNLLKKTFAILSPGQRRTAAYLVVLMIVGMIFETISIGAIIPILAVLSRADFMSDYPSMARMLRLFGSPDSKTLIVWVMSLLVVVYFLKSIFLTFLTWLQTQYALRMQVQIARRLFENYLRQPYAFHLRKNSSVLIRNVLIEVGMFTTNAVTPMLQILSEGLVCVGLFVLLFVVQPKGALLTFLVLGLTGVAFRALTRERVGRWGRERQFHEGVRIQHLQQGLGGVKDVKLIGREEEFLSLFSFHDELSARAAQRQFTLQLLPRIWIEFLAVVALALLVIAMLLQQVEITKIVPVLGVFAATAFRLLPSLNRIFGAFQNLRYGLPVIESVNEQLNLPNEEQDKQVGPAVPLLRNEIRICDLSFKYETSEAETLTGINLTIRHGETVGFIGESGSGKTTLIDLILGLLAPVSGKVEVDGTAIHGSLRSWQDQLGYVPQTIFLTDDTLRRNIAFGLLDADIDETAVLRALKEAQLDGFVHGLPEGLDTKVGERGVRLSGGQRQRIGIARALYHNPSVLVLDEGTSALDGETEAEIMKSVFGLSGKKTILIVAHRLSTVSQCDRIVRLAKGKIVASGKPAEVIHP